MKSKNVLFSSINKPWISLLVVVFTTGFAFTADIKLNPADKAHTHLDTQSIPISALSYERLATGMGIYEAQSVLGPGTEISRTETTITLAWRNHYGYSITAVFEDGKLTEKKQSDA